MSEFGDAYASAYDSLYGDKDYQAECRVLQQVFDRFGQRPVHRILDLGCGTGNHVLPLAAAGCDVVGVDRSEAMLQLAAKKQAAQGLAGVRFEHGDIRQWHADQQFDCVLMMFAVLGYQLENGDALAALRTARRHLSAGGLFIFDVWYGPAVVREQPSTRAKLVTTPEGRVLRLATATSDLRQQVCRVRYNLWRFEQDRIAEETQEEHGMRFFFPKELELLLEETGFTLTHLGGFPEVDAAPGTDTWSVLAIAHAI